MRDVRVGVFSASRDSDCHSVLFHSRWLYLPSVLPTSVKSQRFLFLISSPRETSKTAWHQTLRLFKES